MLDKFSYANLAAKCSVVNLLHPGVAINLIWSGIFFSTTVRAEVVAKLLKLGILFLTSVISALRAVVVAKLVILGILFLTSFI